MWLKYVSFSQYYRNYEYSVLTVLKILWFYSQLLRTHSVGLFDEDEKEEEFVFRQAIDEANDQYLKHTDLYLQGDLINLASYDSFSLSKDCKLLKSDRAHFQQN